MMELSSDHFNKLSQQIYVRLGLQFEDKKLYFLQKRVEKRMGILGFQDPQEYVFLLCYADPEGLEMQALANLITTNETYMFREFEQLEGFANCCLPEVLSAKQTRGEQKIRIWSAGCSSGEEPYTLAIILQEIFPQSRYWDCEIVATDIDQNVLSQAAAAHYWWRSVREVPPAYLEKHFIQEGERYTIRPNIASMVRFQHLNLCDRLAMRAMRNFDFIFCRNVLIYFDDSSRKSVVDHFYNSLNRGGYLFLGHSESVGRISSAFKLKRMDTHLVYVKESGIMKKRILVVDDSEFVRSYHSHILAQASFDVLTAVDGNDGLEKLYAHPCDLILTDINMEHMDGYEFIRRVRAEPQYEDLPIIIVSTEGDKTDKMKGFEAGANLYIVKPSEPATMIENIRLVLAAE